MAKRNERIDWKEIKATWLALGRPFTSDEIVKIKITAGPKTAHAVAVTQQIIPMVVQWMIRAYPNGKYPPINVTSALIGCFERYGKSAFTRHEELADWKITWSEYLIAQSEMIFDHAAAPPNLWTMFNNVGIERYNRHVGESQRIDGRVVRTISPNAMRALTTTTERWRELVGKWERSRNVITNSLVSCPDLSHESVILLESHAISAAYLIADRDGINAIDSGFLPKPKLEAALSLLVELERDKYTAKKFYDAVIEKGALI